MRSSNSILTAIGLTLAVSPVFAETPPPAGKEAPSFHTKIEVAKVLGKASWNWLGTEKHYGVWIGSPPLHFVINGQTIFIKIATGGEVTFTNAKRQTAAVHLTPDGLQFEGTDFDGQPLKLTLNFRKK